MRSPKGSRMPGSSGQLRVWRDNRLMRRHDMLAFTVHITVDADGRGWTLWRRAAPRYGSGGKAMAAPVTTRTGA